MSTAPQSQNPNSSDARTRLLTVASKLFWQNGFNGTSMRDIAREYGCKPANIYNFFPGKEAVLYEVLHEEMTNLLEPLRPILDDENGDPVQQLRTLIRQHLSITLSYRRSAKVLFDVAMEHLEPEHRRAIVRLRDHYDAILRAVLRRGRERSVFADIDEKFAGFMIASMITRCRIWYDPEKSADFDDIADFIFRFTMHGISPRPG
ncbi:MAG: TetR family transcriptional regulator [Desulfatibacillaceae bacterium]